MIFNTRPAVSGKHAFLSPSNYHWLGYDDLPPCIYCNAPWFVFSLDPEHKDGCPMVTEIYPVLPVDLAHEGGFACGKCDSPFKLHSFYKAVSQPDEEDIYVAVCLPCLNY